MAKLILEDTALDAKPIPLVEIITKNIMENDGETYPHIARERAEKLSDQTSKILLAENGKMLKDGRPPRIAFNSSSNYLIQGACFIEPRDSDRVRVMKSRRLQIARYLEALEKLSPAQFEQLCGNILSLFGVEDTVVTRITGDEGIDFYGILALESMFFPKDLTPTLQKQMKIWIVGQAKRYVHSIISTSEIRELVGSLELARAGAIGSNLSPLPNFNIRAVDPVFCMLITTGIISKSSWNLLKKSGVIGVDGDMLATFLADRGIGFQGEKFVADRLITWIAD